MKRKSFIHHKASHKPKRHLYYADYTRNEDIANGLTHLVGFFFAIYFLWDTLTLGGGLLHTICYMIYGGSQLAIYASSTIYHLQTDFRMKNIFKKVDHVVIYWAIAGGYTPFMMLNLRSTLAYVLVTIAWILAVSGSLYKIFYIGKYPRFGIFTYVGMSLLSLIAIKPMMEAMPMDSIVWLLIGGGFYLSGIFFYVRDNWYYNHAIWHLFVMGGTASHWWALHQAFPATLQ